MKCSNCYLRYHCDEQTEFICKSNGYCKYIPEQTNTHVGLYPKYTVTNNRTGLEVYDCFVLKPTKDEAARLALLYYAAICGDEALKNDIKAWLNSD